MKLMELLLESEITSIFNYIVKNNSEMEVVSMVDDQAMDYIDYDQMEDEGMEDELEYYSEFGHGEAETDIVEQLIKDALRKMNKKNLVVSDHVKLFKKIAEHYSLRT